MTWKCAQEFVSVMFHSKVHSVTEAQMIFLQKRSRLSEGTNLKRPYYRLPFKSFHSRFSNIITLCKEADNPKETKHKKGCSRVANFSRNFLKATVTFRGHPDKAKPLMCIFILFLCQLLVYLLLYFLLLLLSIFLHMRNTVCQKHSCIIVSLLFVVLVSTFP